MKQITIDIETASDENIKDCGVYRYAESECFDLLLISYAVDNGPVATCDIANGETLPDDVRNALTDKTVIKKAFHVNFERICLSVYLRRKYPEMLDFKDFTGSYLDPVSWQCDIDTLPLPRYAVLTGRHGKTSPAKRKEDGRGQGVDPILLHTAPGSGWKYFIS